MCLECDGLGERHDFDAELLVTKPDLSLLEGAIPALRPPIGRWRRHIYRTVARWAGGDLHQPWKALPKRAREALLYGTGDTELLFTWHSYYGIWRRREPFEGILTELREKYKTTSSGIMRRFYEKFMRRRTCQACGGTRLNRQALAVRIDGKNIADVCNLSTEQLHAWLGALRLEGSSAIVAEDLLKELRSRLGFLLDVGLGYLTLSRPAPTLSGGEAQRVRLAGQIGGGLVGALYVLDEPSVGLHARDNARLLRTLGRLRDMGNTVVVVEHDEATIRSADYVVDFGPGPGVYGGKVVAAGSLRDICRAKESITGQYLRGRRRIEIPSVRRKPRRGHWLRVLGASHNNLKRINVAIPLGCFVCVTGVSGSGKSSLVNDTIARRLRRDVNGAHAPEPGKHRDIRGLDKIDKVLLIDQSPIGRTPRSNPATYIKVFDLIRALYARLPDARVRGYKPGRFSFNVSAEAGGGRCEACQGHGANKLEMDFLADIWVPCAVCQGRRFAGETLQIHYKGKSIADVLEMTVEQAAEHFANIPKIQHMLQCLIDVGLGYITLGQPSTTLSGGEAQRIKLARELVKRSTGKTLYILDEPTTGLHFEDVKKLLGVLHGFVDAGNTVLIVEHNLDIIKTADWVIDLGPEGGDEGGYIVATGTPEEVARCEQSYTGQALKAVLGIDGDGKAGIRSVVRHRPIRPKRRDGGNGRIRIVGARQNNLKDVTVSLPRGRMTVCTGVSGSGKTSLALETVYNEGQRRYVESLSAYARQFVGRLAKPKVERIEGLSPAIAIEQKGAARSPRSTVATITEIYDYMRLLWARLGEPYCPHCQQPVQQMTVDEIADAILRRLRGRRALIFAPVAPGAGQRWADLIRKLKEAGFMRLRLDGRLDRIEQLPAPAEGQHHDLEVAVDRLDITPNQRSRLIDSIEQAVVLGDGMVTAEPAEGPEAFRYSVRRSCRACGKAFEELSPHHFSFNSPLGWCEVCEGLGTQQGADPEALILRPEKGLLDGAILGWGRIGRDSPLGKMLTALAEQLGFDPSTPWRDLTDSQRSAILYGLEGEWIDASTAWPNLRFQFKGLFPAIEQATRISWHYRKRLEHLAREVPCRACKGSRLRPDAAAVRLGGKTIGEVCSLPLDEALQFFGNLSLSKHQAKVGAELLREIRNRLAFLVDVGLDYLTLKRAGPTLSGGEAQRIRLACQLGSGLTGVLYVLDEPTIGLHPADNRRLLDALRRLRDLGNTLLLVEHDREVIRAADHILDFGPGAGQAGGRIVATGSAKRLARSRSSLTGRYLAGKEAIAVPTNRRPVEPGSTPQHWLIVRGARHNNLKDIDAAFPLGRFTCVTGVSGSGKSSLINDTLWPALARRLHGGRTSPGAHECIDGIEHIDKVICVDQSPIGQTPASNAATYTGLFDEIRKLFARLPASRTRGFTAGRFSFNRPGGRCEQCEGLGSKCVQMHFLPDVWITCEGCGGKRFNAATLEVTYRGKNIAEVLEMSVAEAAELFSEVPKISRILQTLLDVGLGYLPLNWLARRPAGRSTSSMSRQPACTSTTWPNCWPCCTGWSTWATRSCASSTTWT